MAYSTDAVLTDYLTIKELAQCAAPSCARRSEELLNAKLENGAASETGYDDDVVAAVTAALAHIAKARVRATRVIDGYLRASYSLPFTEAPAELEGHEVCLIRYYLWDKGPSEVVRKNYDDTLSWLRDVNTGRVVLIDSSDEEIAPSARMVQYEVDSNSTNFAHNSTDYCDYLDEFL